MIIMGEVQWIKLAIGIFDDEKIRLIETMPEGDEILIIWIKLLIQAGKTNDDGDVYLNQNTPYTEEMLSTIFNCPIESIKMSLSIFEQYGMIEINEDRVINIVNWEKHQNIKGLEKIREGNRKRKRLERERKKLSNVICDSHVTDTECHAIETEEDKEIDKEKKKNNYSAEFDKFWSIYPKKIDKKKAFKLFQNALKEHSFETIIAGTEKYLKQIKNVEQKFIKHPTTFLSHESFLNEYEVRGDNNGSSETTQTVAEQYDLDF